MITLKVLTLFVSFLGTLPRIPGEHLPLKTSPNNPKLNEWRGPLAKFGTNDYIDVLGDGKLSPIDTMSSVPHWLKRFRGNEMQMLIRKRTWKRQWKWSRPQDWFELNKRIDFLYKRLNYKKPPKRPEYPSNY